MTILSKIRNTVLQILLPTDLVGILNQIEAAGLRARVLIEISRGGAHVDGGVTLRLPEGNRGPLHVHSWWGREGELLRPWAEQFKVEADPIGHSHELKEEIERLEKDLLLEKKRASTWLQRYRDLEDESSDKISRLCWQKGNLEKEVRRIGDQLDEFRTGKVVSAQPLDDNPGAEGH